MDIDTRNQSVAELKKRNGFLTVSNTCVGIGLLLVCFKLVMQSEIVITQTPGMPASSVIERSNFDKGAQMATLYAVTTVVASINPGNAEYQKVFLQSYLSPQCYTKVIAEIDALVARLTSQRELGSYYFVTKGYRYDPVVNKHFVLGDVHTVNAAKDTAQPYVFEYLAHVENYRMWVDDLKSYPGDKPHDAEWQKANTK